MERFFTSPYITMAEHFGLSNEDVDVLAGVLQYVVTSQRGFTMGERAAAERILWAIFRQEATS